MHKLEIDTPALIISMPILTNNLLRMGRLARQNGVHLRPHTKTHKSPAIAHWQVKHGAHGITVAKLEEAEMMLLSGLEDILVAYPVVGERKLAHLIRLNRLGQVAVTVDSLRGATALSSAGEKAGVRIPVYVEIDTGLGRCGLSPGEPAARFVKQLTQLPGVAYRGLLTHAGHAHGKRGDELRQIAVNEGKLLVETAALLRDQGIETQEVSVGSTPTAPYVAEVDGVTEIRPGTYVFNDASLFHCGHCRLGDCALSVLTTVVSRPTGDRGIVDAGSKTLSSDKQPYMPGYGLVKTIDGKPLGNVVLERLYEEHGVFALNGVGYNEGSSDHLSVETKLEIIPDHACTTVNMHDRAYLVDDEDRVICRLPIVGRGLVR